MYGRLSQLYAHAKELSAIHAITRIVWPRMYCGVPKKRAIRSAFRPNASVPKAPW
jgi:hypothetical protein